MITKPADHLTEPVTSGEPVTATATHSPPSALSSHISATAWPVTEAPPATRLRGTLRWVIILGLAAGAWLTRETWLPYVPLLSKGNAPAAKAQKPIPVRTAVVAQRDMPVYIN